VPDLFVVVAGVETEIFAIGVVAVRTPDNRLVACASRTARSTPVVVGVRSLLVVGLAVVLVAAGGMASPFAAVCWAFDATIKAWTIMEERSDPGASGGALTLGTATGRDVAGTVALVGAVEASEAGSEEVESGV
jgi:hypothetical protein